MKFYLKILVIVLFAVWVFPEKVMAEYKKKLTREIKLEGLWKFSIINYSGWETQGYNHSDWENLKVPGAWENQGYEGYNGYGFYRKEVVIPENLTNSQLYIMLGYIDDVDEVYFNGILIGFTGSFPPQYKTGFFAKRSYLIQSKLIKIGQKN